MDFKYLALFFVLILSVGIAFAAPPVITGNTSIVDPDFYEGVDRNYFGVNPIVQSGIVTDPDLDFNILSCQYTLYDTNGTNPFTMVEADWNADTNQCQVQFSSAAMYDDYNFNFRVTDDADEDTNGVALYVWYDQNVPSTTATAGTQIYNYTPVTITGTDVATNTGSGSGISLVYYSVDGGTWASAANGTTFNVGGGAGDHVVSYYSVDNLDNNEGTLNTLTVTVNGVTSSVCNLIPLILLALAAAALIGVVGLFATGNLSVQTAIPVAISMIVFIIILVINGTFAGAICV